MNCSRPRSSNISCPGVAVNSYLESDSAEPVVVMVEGHSVARKNRPDNSKHSRAEQHAEDSYDDSDPRTKNQNRTKKIEKSVLFLLLNSLHPSKQKPLKPHKRSQHLSPQIQHLSSFNNKPTSLHAKPNCIDNSITLFQQHATQNFQNRNSSPSKIQSFSHASSQHPATQEN